MTSGIGNLRSRRKPRPKVQPRHPAGGDAPETPPPGGGAEEALRDLQKAGPSLPADSQAPDQPAPPPVPPPVSPGHPTQEPSAEAKADQPLDYEPTDSTLDEDDQNDLTDEQHEGNDADDEQKPDEVARELPDLDLDWTDPLNHVERNTRLSVPNSVVLRFRAVADLPGSAQYTEIMLQAVHDKLAELPELILARRPQEQRAAGSFPFRRRSTPTPATNTDPKTALYMRPNAGEVELLERIVKWATDIIRDGHPGRPKADRSELITAALDAVLPQLRDQGTDVSAAPAAS